MFEGLTEEYIAKTKPRFESWKKFIDLLDNKLSNKLTIEIDENFKKIGNEIITFINTDEEFLNVIKTEEETEEDVLSDYLTTLGFTKSYLYDYNPYNMIHHLRTINKTIRNK